MNHRTVRSIGGIIGSLLLALVLVTACGQAPIAPEEDDGAILEEGAPGTMAEEDVADNTFEEEAEEAPEAVEEEVEEAAEAAEDEIREVEGEIEAFWNGFDWDELTTAEQEAWSTLGWDAESWDEEVNIPDTAEATWEELTEEEQEAAESLGYDQESWDATAPEE
jgi:hypothetical protein